MFDDVVGRTGAIDILVNNAGVQTWKPFLEVTEAEWDLVIDADLKGCFLCSQAAARHMKASRRRSNRQHRVAGTTRYGFPNLVTYTASKGGIEMLTKVAAPRLGPLGIRVNCVAPGAIEVERTRLEDPATQAKMGLDLRRLAAWARPTDVGEAVAFLASDNDVVHQAARPSGWTARLFSQGPWAYRAEINGIRDQRSLRSVKPCALNRRVPTPKPSSKTRGLS